ncbi:uncharacterized protein LOC144167390 [Haemaphysalis longicornis]
MKEFCRRTPIKVDLPTMKKQSSDAVSDESVEGENEDSVATRSVETTEKENVPPNIQLTSFLGNFFSFWTLLRPKQSSGASSAGVEAEGGNSVLGRLLRWTKK